MRWSRLAIILTCLEESIGPVTDKTVFQEDFAGHHHLSSAIFQYGLPVLCRDFKFSRNLDVLKGVGFMAAIAGLRSLCEGGLSWIGVPCSSWIFLSRGSTKRSRLNVRGKRAYKSVRDANRIARRVMYMVHYIEAKGAYWVLENPISSLLWMYKPVRATLQREGIHCISVPLGQYGAVSTSLV